MLQVEYVTHVIFPSQVYIENSGSTGGLQYPFGYLKASTNLTSVNLFIMPYNYPKLIPLIGKQYNIVYVCDFLFRLFERERNCLDKTVSMKS